MPIPAAIGGAALLGGAAANFFGAKSRNKMQIQLAREQMRFQERMSSTAVQRQMVDMRKAGINPILAGQYGGASSPGGAMANVENVAAPAVNSAMAGARLSNEIRMMKKDLEVKDETKRLISQQAAAATATANKLSAERALLTAYPTSGPNSGIPYALQGRMLANDMVRAQVALTTAALPGAKISGSRAAAITNLILRSLTGAGLGFGGGAGGIAAISRARKGAATTRNITNIYDRR